MQRDQEKPLRERARREPLAERARQLTDGSIVANGIKLALISAIDTVQNRSTLEVHFFNTHFLAAINAFAANPAKLRLIFPISGGHRLPAGIETGQVQVTAIAWPDVTKPVLQLTIAPIGDYSTYTLSINPAEIASPAPTIDPLFAEIRFKFRPGCFSSNCAPEWDAAPEPEAEPVIDYLAKDYDSFRHAMIVAMMQRVPGWQPTSEADLDQVLLDLFSAAADELSDYQDRVMNEAYLASARKRVSLARHARLMDYHIHQGNQASTWLALELGLGGALLEFDLQPGLEVWAGGGKKEDAASIVFVTRNNAPQRVHQLLNSLSLYTWSDAIPSLAAGSTSADLKLYLQLYLDDSPIVMTPASDSTSAHTVEALIRGGKVTSLLIQERLNPVTGARGGRDPGKRQLLRLLPGDAGAQAMLDPITNEWFVRVRWQQEDALRQDYCFTVDCPGGRVEHVTLFHGNLIEAHHGRPKTAVFKEPSELLNAANEFHYERTPRWGTLCTLPDRDLAYLSTPPGGDEPPFSTLKVSMLLPVGAPDPWDEVPNLIHSDGGAESGDHFVVETDEESPDGLRRSRIRFGNGVNGRELPAGATVKCEYQTGQGLAGNIGADKLTGFDQNTPFSDPVLLRVRRCWNPFDVTDGRAPEPAAEIIRRVPEAYRTRQLRAVTLRDYVQRAEKIPGVARAAASYAWTGSWRTVRVTIDPVGTNILTDPLRRQVARALDAVRLIGEDIEIRPPRFVPLEISITLCASAEYWPEDVKFILEQEFSATRTPDGRLGFFHPDRWTFGQPLHESQILGRAQSVTGVEHVVSITMKRWNDASAGADFVGNLRPNEIIQVLSDPDHREPGFIEFEVLGGRQ